MNVARGAGPGRTPSLVLLIALLSLVAGEASAGTLDVIKRDKAVRIAYRDDARPFSYKDGNGQPAGYMVDLCRAVAKNVAKQLQTSSLKLVYVPVTAANRFETIRQNKADLLCEATSATLARRELVDFSIATYVGGTSLMIPKDGPRDLKSMAGRKIGVLGGTTTEEALRKALKKAGVVADVHAGGELRRALGDHTEREAIFATLLGDAREGALGRLEAQAVVFRHIAVRFLADQQDRHFAVAPHREVEGHPA